MTDRYPTVPGDDLAAGGWTLRDRTAEALFRTPTATVEGHTVVYEDAALADALSAVGAGDRLAGGRSADGATDGDGGSGGTDRGSGDAGSGGTDRGSGDTDGGILAGRTDGEGPWRFFFATALSFSPPLVPGIGTATVIPTVLSEARRSFADDLRGRGFRDVERGRSERMPIRSGDRARLTTYTAELDVPRGRSRDEPVTLSVEAFLAVWAAGGAFRIAGGAHPVSGLDDLLADVPAADRPGTDPRAFRSELLELIRDVA